MTQAMGHEPRRLLCYADVSRQLCAGYPFPVACKQPDSHEPLSERNLGVLKNRADFRRELEPAIAAHETAAIGVRVNSQ